MKATDLRALAALAAVGVLGACAGENLFTVPGTGSGGSPTVEITAPTAGATFSVGAPVSVAANGTAQAGGATAEFKGVYSADGATAYTPQSVSISGLVNVALSAELVAAPGQAAGTAVIIVTLTDQAGNRGADSVTVTIAN
ncbi:MAG: hypothetical protein R3253_09055 [Longimicrobiales bacterium]|nr:hypothetical protein [Longimicrobiales bacterium]